MRTGADGRPNWLKVKRMTSKDLVFVLRSAAANLVEERQPELVQAVNVRAGDRRAGLRNRRRAGVYPSRRRGCVRDRARRNPPNVSHWRSFRRWCGTARSHPALKAAPDEVGVGEVGAASNILT